MKNLTKGQGLWVLVLTGMAEVVGVVAYAFTESLLGTLIISALTVAAFALGIATQK